MKSVINFVLLFNLWTACIHGLVVEEVETEKFNEAEKVYPGVDELFLGAYNGTDFRCSSGEYIPREDCCDDIVDCKDWSDEAMTTCDALNKTLVCPDEPMLVCSTSFQCYYPEDHCDGLTYCLDISDEANCTEKIQDQEEAASQDKDKDEDEDEDEDGDNTKDDKYVATHESTKVDPKTTTIPATSTMGVTTQKLVTAKIEFLVPVPTSKIEVNVPKKCLKKPSKKKCHGLVPHIASKMPKKKVQKCLKKPAKRSCKNIKIVLDFIQNCQENPIDKDCNIIGNTFDNIGKTKTKKNKRKRAKKSGKKSGSKKRKNKNKNKKIK